MDVRIQSIHFDASEQLQAFIQKKVSKLEKYYEDIKKVEVSLKVVKPEVAANKEAGIKILIPNGEFYASKVCDTFEEAIDLDVEALEKQLVKYKEKQRMGAAGQGKEALPLVVGADGVGRRHDGCGWRGHVYVCSFVDHWHCDDAGV